MIETIIEWPYLMHGVYLLVIFGSWLHISDLLKKRKLHKLEIKSLNTDLKIEKKHCKDIIENRNTLEILNNIENQVERNNYLRIQMQDGFEGVEFNKDNKGTYLYNAHLSILHSFKPGGRPLFNTIKWLIRINKKLQQMIDERNRRVEK